MQLQRTLSSIGQWGALPWFLASAALLPGFSGNAYVLHVAILAMIHAVFAASWNLATGITGLKSFGHQAFFGIGAYGSALLSMQAGLSPWFSVWIAALAAAAAGCLIALPVLRLKSVPHVAIVTLAFAEIVRLVLSNAKELTRGEMGLSGIPALPDIVVFGLRVVHYDVAAKTGYYYTALALLLLSLLCLGAVIRSRTGLALMAIRDSETAAESLGIGLTAHKMAAFALSALLVGLAGAFYAHYVLVLTPGSAAGVELMMLIVSIVLVGGLGSFAGPVIAAFVLTCGLEGLRGLGEYRMLIYGGLIVVVVLGFPDGLASAPVRLRRLWARAGPASRRRTPAADRRPA
ncbi:branched-chain amino acid ABC transporter permease [Variovorax sp. LjRoot84]|uniref:branched-chain amino acid ABC transporter permease n=1 Tax=Variovorax sp. LjRoot84 TaxID=3342340 RepID=UPI003ECEE3C2